MFKSMNTHKEEKLGRVVVTQGEYKGLEGFACDYDPKKGTYNVDFNTGRTGPFHRIELAPLVPTPPSQIEEEPRIGATLELLATQRGKLLEALVDTSYVYTDSKQARVVYLEEIKKIDELMLALNNTK